MVRAEAGAAALIVTLAQVALLSIGAVALWDSPEVRLSASERTGAAAAGLLLPLSLNFMGLMIMNGAALLFPRGCGRALPRGWRDHAGADAVTAAVYLLGPRLSALIVPGPRSGRAQAPCRLGTGGRGGVAAAAVASGIRPSQAMAAVWSGWDWRSQRLDLVHRRHRGRPRQSAGGGWNCLCTERRYSRSTWV